MLITHNSNNRGQTRTDWLNSAHTFSMGGFHDPDRINHRALRVLNEDRVSPAKGFGTHPHQDMDIISFVISGALSHQDSIGNGSTIRPGEIQVMSAGTGIRHSEMNPSNSEAVHFYQIWIIPEQNGLAPTYQQKAINPAGPVNALHLIAAPQGSEDTDNAVQLNSDTRIYLCHLDEGAQVSHRFDNNRAGFLQMISGRVETGGEILQAGDGHQFDDTPLCQWTAQEAARFLLFDLK